MVKLEFVAIVIDSSMLHMMCVHPTNMSIFYTLTSAHCTSGHLCSVLDKALRAERPPLTLPNDRIHKTLLGFYSLFGGMVQGVIILLF